jgi:predicted O-methyltransferase YrrM
MRCAETAVPEPAGGAAPWQSKSFRGPLFDLVESVLARHPEYALHRDGLLADEAWYAFVERAAGELSAAGVPADDVHFAKRFPGAPARFVREALARLVRAGILRSDAYDESAADAAAADAARYEHGGLGTYIYPEEGRLLFALADLIRPAHAVFLGSYYGYWAAWAIPALAAHGGRVTLVDPDPSACAVARRNFARHGAAVRVVTATGQEALAAEREPIDLVVIDAELPRTHPDPGLRGKGVYRALLAAALPRLAPTAHVVAHNILLADATGDAVLAEVVARNAGELGPFLALAGRELDGFAELSSTEGVGVGVRAR